MTNWWNALTKDRRPEKTVFGLFILLLLLTMYFHEPWFDEIQAWLIAQDASWHDLLWVLPHYEGHPPFFHLLLAIPARLGVSGLVGLRCVGAAFSIAAAYLIIFKSPFPRVARLCLPFSYFLFYQYGVIVRPYNLMWFLMCLLAVYFPQKDKRPGLFVLLLAALCACHVYGLAIAGGIAMAWLWEIKGTASWKDYFKNLLHDERFHWLLRLLVWALLMLVWISPREDTYATNSIFQQAAWWERALYLLLIMPADALFTDIFGFSAPLAMISFPVSLLVYGSLAGAAIWLVTLMYLPREKWKFILIPFGCLVLSMMYYVYRHHIGLALLVLLWGWWISWPPVKKLPFGAKALCTLVLLVPIAWTGCSVYWDIMYPGPCGKPLVQFLQQHRLEHKRIFTDWVVFKAENFSTQKGVTLTEDLHEPNHTPLATIFSFYAPGNIFANLNNQAPIRYATHIALSPQQVKQQLQVWRQGPLPDIWLGEEGLRSLFKDNPAIQQNYAIVGALNEYHFWKFNSPRRARLPIYAHLSLIEPHQLHPQDTFYFFLTTLGEKK